MVGFASSGCSSDSSPASTKNDSPDGGGAGGSTSTSPEASTPSTPDAFNGDCSTARWGHQTKECWDCLCGACPDSLNKCNGDCVGIIECAESNHVLADKTSDISCEVTGTTVTCLKDTAVQAQAQALITFDTCLLSTHPDKLPNDFRTCDTVCNVTYSGDVCTKFPNM
ncbi:MAG TPA: hypothetical protein VH062_13845 [Polyangiaceae bacterium]|nr:hypothetical protein [Polyangiaceae bacterium]